MMKAIRFLVLIAVAVGALTHVSDGQQARPLAEQFALAGITPRGALVYVQARDLSGLMKTWLASPIRQQYYDSASFNSFSQSHAYLKLQDRKKDLEAAIGVGIDEERLAELAGGASAVAVYDIGKLELVLVTEVARERAIATALFKQVAQFQERPVDGISYYVREVTTDGGRLNQQFCFAHLDGRLIVTTTEGLMIRAIRNARSKGSDALLADVIATAEKIRGLSSRDVTMWLDQAKLNGNMLFNSYWIHHNSAAASNAVDSQGRWDESLSGIASGLIDLRFTPEGITEQRWFVVRADAPANAIPALPGERVAALLKLAPATAQFVEVRPVVGAGERLARSVSQALFGELKQESAATASGEEESSSDSNRETGGFRAARYSRLDSRFDLDVDDETALRRGVSPTPGAMRSGPVTPAGAAFEKAVTGVIGSASASAYASMIRSRSEVGRPFVRFERAIAIELKPGANVDRSALERAIADEMRSRFVVTGVDPGLSWRDDAGVRYLAQSLLEQGAAYGLSGRYLIVASSRDFVRDVIAAAAATGAGSAIEGQLDYYAVIRVADARPTFDKLMNKLDGKVNAEAQPPASREESEEGQADVKFFSDNLSSLVRASLVREIRVRRRSDGPIASERLVYSW